MCFNTTLIRSVQHAVRRIVGYQILIFNWSVLDEKPSACLVLRCDARFHPVCMGRNDISSQAAWRIEPGHRLTSSRRQDAISVMFRRTRPIFRVLMLHVCGTV